MILNNAALGFAMNTKVIHAQCCVTLPGNPRDVRFTAGAGALNAQVLLFSRATEAFEEPEVLVHQRARA